MRRPRPWRSAVHSNVRAGRGHHYRARPSGPPSRIHPPTDEPARLSRSNISSILESAPRRRGSCGPNGPRSAGREPTKSSAGTDRGGARRRPWVGAICVSGEVCRSERVMQFCRWGENSKVPTAERNAESLRSAKSARRRASENATHGMQELRHRAIISIRPTTWMRCFHRGRS